MITIKDRILEYMQHMISRFESDLIESQNFVQRVDRSYSMDFAEIARNKARLEAAQEIYRELDLILDTIDFDTKQ